MLEMKELNERQKAEHVQQMLEQQKEQLRLLEQRNVELEEKFDKVQSINYDRFALFQFMKSFLTFACS